MSSQLINELFPDCTRSCFAQVVSRCRDSNGMDEMRCLFVGGGVVLFHGEGGCPWLFPVVIKLPPPPPYISQPPPDESPDRSPD